MPSYRCLFAGGREATLEAASVPAALLQAQQTGEHVARINEEKPRLSEPRVTEQELATFYRQLGSMLEAGLPLAEGLQTIARDTTNAGLKEVCHTLYQTLSAGEPLAAGLAKFPSLFPRLYLALARAGEHAGLLPVMLSQIADYLEHLGRLGRRFSAALVYPAVVGCIVLFLLSGYWGSGIIREMSKIFNELGMGNSVPLITGVVMAIYRFALPTFSLTLITVFILMLIIRAYYRTRRGRYRLDRVKLWLPFIGQIVHRGALARFCRTLALLLDNGVNIEEALELAGEASGNAVIARAIRSAIGEVVEGAPLAASLEASGVFPAPLTEQLTSGEKSGSLIMMLNSLADFYDAQTDHYSRAFSAVVEPALIVLIGFAVGTSIIALMLPLVQAIRSLSGAD